LYTVIEGDKGNKKNRSSRIFLLKKMLAIWNGFAIFAK